MNAQAARAFEAACLGLLLLAAAGAPARAQPPGDAAAYEDRLIGGGSLAPDISLGDYAGPDTSGLARSIRVEIDTDAIRTGHSTNWAYIGSSNGLAVGEFAVMVADL